MAETRAESTRTNIENRQAPHFSRTPPEISRPPARPGEHTDEALADWTAGVLAAGPRHDRGRAALFTTALAELG